MATKKDRPWHNIKAQLAEKRTSLASLARQLHKSKAALSIIKTYPVPMIQSAIAEALDEKPQDIWPSRYDKSGKPIRPIKWMKDNSARSELGHRQKRRAA